MKKGKMRKLVLSGLVVVLVLCFISPVNSKPQIPTSHKKKVGIIGFSNSAFDIIEFIKENYGKSFKIVRIKPAEKIDDSFQIIIAYHSEFIKLQSSSYYDKIYDRIKAGSLALLLLEEIMETNMKIQEITYNMTLNLDTEAQSSGLISTESKMKTFRYHAYVEYHRSNEIEVIKRYESKTYKDYIKWLKNSLVNIIENFESKSSELIKIADDSQWIKKKEIIGENDFGDYEIYTRIDIYKCIYTDQGTNPWSDYYRIDYFVHHNVKDFDWELQNVGPYAYQRIMYADANYEDQELHKYAPTGTIGTNTLSYTLSFIISYPSPSVEVGFSKSWSQPDVIIKDQSSMVNDYAKWTESFEGPDYHFWPWMNLCVKPCLVSRSAFYSEPALVVQVPTETGLVMPHLNTEYRFAHDHDFVKIFFVLFWTRTIYVINSWTSWIYVCIDKGSGNGGGCPILSVYNGEQYVEEGLLDIHAYEDVITRHRLTTTPQLVDNKYLLRFTEHPMTMSHIDQVHLLAILKNGKRVLLPLVSALHSTNGDVMNELLLNDDVRVDCLGADFNNGESESIDLEFLALKNSEIQEFIFLIEGYNMHVK